MLYLLTAPSGTGKTTALCRLAALARQNGARVAGVLSLTERQRGAIWLEDLATARRRLLAHVAAPAEAHVGRWRFVPAAVAWGNACLAAIRQTDVLLVDEIGPLELVSRRGLTAALVALRAAEYRLAVAVVRPALVARLAEMLSSREPRVVRLTPHTRDVLPARLVRAV